MSRQVLKINFRSCSAAVLPLMCLQQVRADLPPFLLDPGSSNVAGAGGWAAASDNSFSAFIVVGQPAVGTISNASHTIELGVVPCFNPFLGITQDVEWVRALAAGDGLYADTANWNPAVVPDNNAPGDTLYRAIIPDNLATNLLNLSPRLTWLALAQSATLKINQSAPSVLTTLEFESTGLNVSNSGLIRVEASSSDRTLKILNGNIYQGDTKGRLQAQGGLSHARIELENSAVAGGKIEALAPNSSVLFRNTTLADVALTGDMDYVNNQLNSALEGTIVNNANTRILGMLNQPSIVSAGGAGATIDTSNGTGRITLTDTDGSQLGIDDSPGILINSMSHMIQGRGVIRGLFRNEGLLNSGGGVLANDSVGPLIIRTSSLVASVVNNGDFVALDGGTLRIERNVSGNGRLHAQGSMRNMATIEIPADTPTTVEAQIVEILPAGLVRVDLMNQLTVAAHVRIGCLPALRGCTPPLLGRLQLNDSSGSQIGGNLEIGEYGQADLAGSSQTTVATHVRLEGCQSAVRGCTPPSLNIAANANLVVAGNIELREHVEVTVAQTAAVSLAGNFDNQTSESSRLTFNWAFAPLVMNGAPPLVKEPTNDRATGRTAPQSFELAGEDFGPRDPSGFVNNFAMGTLRIDPARTVNFADAFDNLPASPCEVLYVDTLSLGAGSTITLNGCNVYYRNLVREPGAASVLQSGALLLSTHVGDLDGDSDIDSADVSLFANALVGASPCNSVCMTGADNGDGTLDAHDIPVFISFALLP